MPCCKSCGKCGSKCDAWMWCLCCSRNKCRRGPLSAPNNLSDMRYADAVFWSYIWAVGYFGYVIVQITASHLPLIITSIEGHPEWWSNCGTNPWCYVLSEHILVLVTGYWTVQALFICFRLKQSNVRTLLWFYYWGSPGLAVYFLLENMLFTSALVPPPGVTPHGWEAPLRAIEMLYLVPAMALTWWAHYKVYIYLNPKYTDGIIRPRTKNEVRMWVRRAARAGALLRCVGSSHSAPGVIFGTGDELVWRMSLTYMRNVKIYPDPDPKPGEPEAIIAEVQGGCNLGPCSTDDNSTEENSLCYQLNEKGYALQDLGGITEQTVAGFLSTGSAGGTRKYDIFGDVQSITMINGKGEEVEHKTTDDTWSAAAISLGCFGIIVGVKFKLTHKAYGLKGQEVGTQLKKWPSLKTNTPIAQVAQAQVKLAKDAQDFGKTHSPYATEEYMALAQNHAEPVVPRGFRTNTPADDGETKGTAESKGEDQPVVQIEYAQPPTNVFESIGGNKADAVVNFFDNAAVEKYTNGETGKNYFRWMWYPQPTCQRAVFWAANRAEATVASDAYTEIPVPGVSGRVLQALYNKVQSHIPPYGKTVESLVAQAIEAFVDPKEDQEFSGIWFRQLPMDNQMPATTSTKIEFLEIWVPIEYTAEVTNTLHEYFNHDEGLLLSGTMAIEMYACKGNDFLLSPGYHDPATGLCGDKFRVDFFWFVSDRGNPQLYFNQFYHLFASTLTPANIPWRFHLGKYWPDPDNKSGGLDHIKAMYTDRIEEKEQDPNGGPDRITVKYVDRIEKWNEARKEQDPNDMFLTAYWAAHLGLPGAIEVDWVNVATNETQGLLGGLDTWAHSR